VIGLLRGASRGRRVGDRAAHHDRSLDEGVRSEEWQKEEAIAEGGLVKVHDNDGFT
jgi:hypothetical protein